MPVRDLQGEGREVAPRVAAAAAAGCLAVHLVLLAVGGRELLALTVPMLVLSAACSACALRAWRSRCTDIELALMACVGGLMAAAHLMLAPMHHSHAVGVEESPWSDVLMHLGVTLGGSAGLLAAAVLLLRSISRRRR
jgi:hypothetical protein